MDFFVAGQIYIYEYQRPHTTTISIPHKMGDNIVAAIHIDGERSTFLLFYYHQDIEFELTNINSEKTSKPLWDKNSHTPQVG